MKVKKVFSWFSTFVLFFSMLGVVPASVDAVASPFVQIGPKAVKASGATQNEDLFTCQVGLAPGVVCYDPAQIRHAYQVDNLINAGYDGTGRTIVIVDAFQSPTLPDDLDAFDANYGLPDRATFFTQIAPDGLTPFDPNDENMVGWSSEISLDVEWAHAIAPGANIVLDLAKSNDDADILSATQYAVDHNLGDVISQSFGENESCVDANLLKAEHALFIKATLKHITLFASSGDEGAAEQTCDGNSWVKAASSPASDPLVTAVGGTELHAADYCLAVLGCDPGANPAAGTYQGEIAWNEPDFAAATGGGFSVLYKEPFYQFGTIPLRIKARGVPDVAYNAAILHGVLVYWAGDVWLFGGTSCGSPQWAAILAIADQKAGRRLGFINTALYVYSLSQKKYKTLFNDVTSGNNSVVETDSNNNPVAVDGFNADSKWDATTGLGSPKADQVVAFLTRFTKDNDGSQASKGTDPGNSGHFGHHHMGPN